MPIVHRAITHSAVSAAVTHGWSDTQRTPRPSITNSSQRSAMRARAWRPVTAPQSTG